MLKTTDGGATWTDTGAVVPDSALGSFFRESVLRSAVTVGGNLWAVGADQLILSTLDTSADTAPPLTSDDGDRRWHNSAVTVSLHAANPGGSGVAGTEYKLDSGAWQPAVGGSVTVDAPADHSGDGVHNLYYRSSDVAGNVEFPQLCAVRIDTRPPTTTVGSTVTVRTGKTATLTYRVADATPNGGTATVRMTIRNAAGATVKTLALGLQPVNKKLTALYLCKLAAGTYTYTVTATDTAGNAQSTAGVGKLVVKK